MAWSVGWRGKALIVACAICQAESDRCAEACGVNRDGSRDRGLWQINDRYHPDVSDACAFDPWCNAESAFAIYRRAGGFTPWSTYNNGAYLDHMRVFQDLYNAHQWEHGCPGAPGGNGPPPPPQAPPGRSHKVERAYDYFRDTWTKHLPRAGHTLSRLARQRWF